MGEVQFWSQGKAKNSLPHVADLGCCTTILGIMWLFEDKSRVPSKSLCSPAPVVVSQPPP
jgi:hypothetical protein